MILITFPILKHFEWLKHGFIPRIPDLAGMDRAVLQNHHRTLLGSSGIPWKNLFLARQVHGNQVIPVDKETACSTIPECDGLVTSSPAVALGIHVADCCAVYLIETRMRMIGLLHSGRRGTEQNIAREGMKQMIEKGGKPSHVVAALSPCIHECCYDKDFVSPIEEQLRVEGVAEIWRHPDCTGCHLDRYYSYRKEKGKTGRMLAFAMICPE